MGYVSALGPVVPVNSAVADLSLTATGGTRVPISALLRLGVPISTWLRLGVPILAWLRLGVPGYPSQLGCAWEYPGTHLSLAAPGGTRVPISAWLRLGVPGYPSQLLLTSSSCTQMPRPTVVGGGGGGGGARRRSVGLRIVERAAEGLAHQPSGDGGSGTILAGFVGHG